MIRIRVDGELTLGRGLELGIMLGFTLGSTLGLIRAIWNVFTEPFTGRIGVRVRV